MSYEVFFEEMKELRKVKKFGDAADALKAKLGEPSLDVATRMRVALDLAHTFIFDHKHREALTILDLPYLNSNPHKYRLRALIFLSEQRWFDAATEIDALSQRPNLPTSMIEELVFARMRAIVVAGQRTESFSPMKRPTLSEANGAIMLVMMVRDEDDIVAENLEHHYLLGFRKFVIALNCCSDDTANKVSAFKNSHQDAVVVTVDDPVESYYQAGKTNALVRYGFDFFEGVLANVIWCFLLDADEFIAATRPIGVIVEEAEKSGLKALSMKLRNATNSLGIEIGGTSSIYDTVDAVQDNPSRIVLKNAFRIRDVNISMGNHTLSFANMKTSDFGAADEYGLSLIHLPYRSFRQVEKKIVNGGKAVGATNLASSFGSHWRKSYERYLTDGANYIQKKLQAFQRDTMLNR